MRPTWASDRCAISSTRRRQCSRPTSRRFWLQQFRNSDACQLIRCSRSRSERVKTVSLVPSPAPAATSPSARCWSCRRRLPPARPWPPANSRVGVKACGGHCGAHHSSPSSGGYISKTTAAPNSHARNRRALSFTQPCPSSPRCRPGFAPEPTAPRRVFWMTARQQWSGGLPLRPW